MTAIINFAPPRLEVTSRAPGLAMASDSPGRAGETSKRGSSAEFAGLMNPPPVKKETGNNGNFDRSVAGAGNTGEVGTTETDTGQGTGSARPDSVDAEEGGPGTGMASVTGLMPPVAAATEPAGRVELPAIQQLTGHDAVTGKLSTGIASGNTTRGTGTPGEPSLAAQQGGLNQSAVPVATTDARGISLPTGPAIPGQPGGIPGIPGTPDTPAGNGDRPALSPAGSLNTPTLDSAQSAAGETRRAALESSGRPGSGVVDAGFRAVTASPATSGERNTGPAPDLDSAAVSTTAGGKELPGGGKPLPAVLTQTPAVTTPGLSDRIDQMIRSVGNDRRRLPGRQVDTDNMGRIGESPGDSPGLDKSPVATIRTPGAELFSRIVAQAPVTGASVDPATAGTSTNVDSPPASLLGQSLAGADKSLSGKASITAGLDGNGSLTLDLQQPARELGSQLSNRIRWMGNLNLSSAELKLHPAELGTLEILISAEDDQTRVSFITSTAAAKEQIEASLPRLRELLGQSGLLLEQGDVSHRDLRRESAGEQPAGPGARLGDSLEPEVMEQLPPFYRRAAGDHQIDHFA